MLPTGRASTSGGSEHVPGPGQGEGPPETHGQKGPRHGLEQEERALQQPIDDDPHSFILLPFLPLCLPPLSVQSDEEDSPIALPLHYLDLAALC